MPCRYGMLFEEDREYNQGPFAEALRDQYVDERNNWLEDLSDAILESRAAADAQTAELDSLSPDIQLSAEDFKRAILAFDKDKPEKEIDR
jgi:hypothetical protein